MTITEKYRTWLIENNIIPIGPEIEKRKLTDAVNKAHGVFMDVNNPDDDANHNAVQRLCKLHDKASHEGRAHMENLINGKGHEETSLQIDEHGRKNHPLVMAVRAHRQK